MQNTVVMNIAMLPSRPVGPDSSRKDSKPSDRGIWPRISKPRAKTRIISCRACICRSLQIVMHDDPESPGHFDRAQSLRRKPAFYWHRRGICRLRLEEAQGRLSCLVSRTPEPKVDRQNMRPDLAACYGQERL